MNDLFLKAHIAFLTFGALGLFGTGKTWADPIPAPGGTPVTLPTVAPVLPPPPVAPLPTPAPVIAPTLPLPASITHSGIRATRVAITEFKVIGESASPTLSMQLQDGFVVGLTRTAPIYVLDSVDVARYMDSFPELHKCEGSICVKRFGQLLDVSHLIRVTVTVTGNSYTLTGRLFSTENVTPAAVPVATETRFCNVCTVDDARQKMVQLGDELKRPVVTWLDAWRPPPPPPPQPESWRRPLAVMAVVAGFTTAIVGGALYANAPNEGPRWKTGLAGLLVGMGASTATVGCYVLIALPSDMKKTTGIAVAFKY